MTDIVESMRENVAEQLNESAGYWHSCSGCHESIDGHSVTPIDPIFRCSPGGGCRECGGIGVVWDNIDYDDFVKFNIEEDRKAAEITKLRAERDEWKQCCQVEAGLRREFYAAARDMRERCASEAFVVLTCVVISDTGGTELADHVASAIRALPDTSSVMATVGSTS